MSGVTPSWLQEIRDYWAQLADEHGNAERGRKTQTLSQSEQDPGRATYALQPRATVPATVAATGSTDN